MGTGEGDGVGVGVAVGCTGVAVGSGCDVGVMVFAMGVKVGKAGGNVSCGVLDAGGGDTVGVTCEQATSRTGKSKNRTLNWFTDHLLV